MNRSPRTARHWAIVPAIASLIALTVPACATTPDEDIDVSEFVDAASATEVTPSNDDSESNDTEESLLQELNGSDDKKDEKKDEETHAAVQELIADPFGAEEVPPEPSMQVADEQEPQGPSAGQV